jgi:hypothetical protein
MLFARGAGGLAWPALIEKAYARLVLGDPTDQPDLRRLEADLAPDVGMPLGLLTGWREGTWVDFKPAEAWDLLTRVCPLPDGTARVPIVLSTRRDREVLRTGLVPNHAYTVLGIHEDPRGRWVILRNPWAHFAPPGPTTLGAWQNLAWYGTGAVELGRLAPVLAMVHLASPRW